MPERSELMNDSTLPDGTARSQVAAAECVKCGPADYKRGFVAVEQRPTSPYDVADNRPELLDDSFVNEGSIGVLGRSGGWQR